MKIQLIGHETRIIKNIKCSRFKDPQSPDDFDINIIDLNSSGIWYCKSSKSDTINDFNDFVHLSEMISDSKKTKVLIVYPENYYYYYHFDTYNLRYHYKDELKNKLHVLLKIESLITQLPPPSIFFEKTETTINDLKFLSDFRFDTTGELRCSTKSDVSEKSTTVKLQHPNKKIEITLTTLHNITKDEKSLQSFLKHIGLIEIKDAEPEWIKSYDKFDDKKIKAQIDKNKRDISKLQQEITKGNEILEQNKKWKSILYENGENLVKVVFNVLEKLLDYDFSDRKDNFKEDFLIKKEGVVFVGEIKGVSHNVKNSNISQAVTNRNICKENLESENIEENVKGLLVINHQRDKPLENREPIHNNQIEEAERNQILIIETSTLLDIFEKHQKNDISAAKYIEIFKNKVGVLKIDDFKD
jgi:hypothetical protein